MAIAALMLSLGVLLHVPIVCYSGPPQASEFSDFIFGYIGAYSDIPFLYFRDHLWEHPRPYFDYVLEYPVGLGVYIWLTSFFNSSVSLFFLVSALGLALCGLLVVWFGLHIEGANLWLLVLSPAFVIYAALNWDFLAIAPFVLSLLLFRRDRDDWGAAMLTVSVWIKFFPVVVLPVVIADRLIRRRNRAALRIGVIFGALSLAINLPFALTISRGGIGLRESWLHFFRYSSERTPQTWSANFWNLLDPFEIYFTLGQINIFSAMLLTLGLEATIFLIWQAHRRGFGLGRDLVLPATLIALAWFFFINKVYSPQYSLWIVVLLALLAVSTSLVVAFAGADLLFAGSIWIGLYLSNLPDPADDGAGWVFAQAVWPAMVIREVVILGIIGWTAWNMLHPPKDQSKWLNDRLAFNPVRRNMSRSE